MKYRVAERMEMQMQCLEGSRGQAYFIERVDWSWIITRKLKSEVKI